VVSSYPVCVQTLLPAASQFDLNESARPAPYALTMWSRAGLVTPAAATMSDIASPWIASLGTTL